MSFDEEVPSISEATPPKSSGMQFRLRTLILLIAVIAVWSGYFQTIRQIEQAETYFPRGIDFDRRLHIDDPQQYAAVNPNYFDPLYGNDPPSLQVYLPRGHRYRLCITGQPAADPTHRTADLVAEESREILAGQHELHLGEVSSKWSTAPRWYVAARVDGIELFQFKVPFPPSTLNPKLVNEIRASVQTPTDQPLLLIDRLYPEYAAQVEGNVSDRELRLWIEKID